MKNKILTVICIILLGFCFIYGFFVMGIMDLVNKKDVYEVTITQAYDILEVEHSINGLIPTGKDYYYVGFNENEQGVYLIHAGKNWLSDHFDAEGNAKTAGGYTVKALAKRENGYETERELASRLSQIGVTELALDNGKILQANYVCDAILKIVIGILILIVGIVGYVFNKMGDRILPVMWRVYAVILVAVLFVALWVIPW